MSSRHFSIWIVSPPRYLHSRCFEESGVEPAEATDLAR